MCILYESSILVVVVVVELFLKKSKVLCEREKERVSWKKKEEEKLGEREREIYIKKEEFRRNNIYINIYVFL